MRKLARNIKRVQEEEEQVKLAIVAANNHYAGFGSGTVNIFSEYAGFERSHLAGKRGRDEIKKRRRTTK